jgi:hypothetical protein
MSRIANNLIAYRILSMMVTPFEDTDAFKLGIIDKDGKNLRKASSLRNSQEKSAYSYLHRLVFNMKKIVNRVGGESRLKSMVAALWLIREYQESGSRTTSLMEEKYTKLMKILDNVTLVEEELAVKKFLEEEGIGGAPTNNTAGASVSEPKIYRKDVKKHHRIARRKPINAPEIKAT